MEDAGRAIKRVREELAKKDKANGTSVSESLDLANLVKKIDRGFFDAPADVLGGPIVKERRGDVRELELHERRDLQCMGRT